MSIAWRLAQAGARITVLEAGRAGSEASWAGAGMLAPGGEFETRGHWCDLALESLRLYPGFVDELQNAASARIDFRNCGAFQIALSDEEAERLRSRAEQQSAIGIYSEQFHPGRIPGLREGAAGAQYYPHDAVVNPRDVVRALVVACCRAGVTVQEHHAVREIPEDWPFDFTVIAAGAWSGSIRLGNRSGASSLPETTPVRGHLIAYEEDTGLCDAIIRRDSTYLLRRAGNVVIAGASTEEAGFDRTIDGAIAKGLAERAGDLMPALAGRPYAAWNGFRPRSATGEPVLERVPGTMVWLAYGHYRNGILLAPVTAARIAGEIMQASSRTDSSAPAASRQ